MHSNMASDYWEPRHFRDLSARLVRQNRVIVVGAACLAIMLWTQGEAAVLLVLYSINSRARGLEKHLHVAFAVHCTGPAHI